MNPNINWANKHIDIHEVMDQTEEYNMAISQGRFTIQKAREEFPTHPELLQPELEKEPPIFLDKNFINYVRGAKHIYVNRVNQFEKINGKLIPLAITKTSIASKLAQKAKEVHVTLPEEYIKFTEVFSKEASQRMPPG